MNASTQAELEELRRIVWQLRDTLAAHQAVIRELAFTLNACQTMYGFKSEAVTGMLAHPLVVAARRGPWKLGDFVLRSG